MWKKQIPSDNGWYWCRSKGKHGWSATPALVTTLGEHGKGTKPAFDKEGRAKRGIVIEIATRGVFIIHEGRTEAEARKIFKFNEALFWSEPMVAPPSPAQKKRKVKNV